MKNAPKNTNSRSRQQGFAKHKSARKSETVGTRDKNVEEKPERIAKRMARAGLCSRRDAEKWITDGRVKLNGEVLQSPAVTVTLQDEILVDGKELPSRERTRLWLYHKPTGLLTTNKDPENRPTIFDKLPADLPRLMTIGRLDMNTEGLLLMTNDGGLARVLELPTTGWLRRYRVRAHGKVEQSRLDELREGIAVGGVLYGSAEATIDREQGANSWLTVSIREGKNREVKNILGAIGLDVNRLIRISYGPFQLGELASGEIMEIRGRVLRDQLGEKLVREAGADFNAPLNQNRPGGKSDKRKSPQVRKTSGDKKQAAKSSGNRKPQQRTARGTIADGTRDRLTTRKSDGGTGAARNTRKTRTGGSGRKKTR